MKLSEITANLECRIYGSNNAEVKGIDYDSRRIKKGYVFVALPGNRTDGKNFIEDAVKSGASAVVSDEYKKIDKASLVVVSDTFKAIASMSAVYYGYPDKKLFVIGITGTNGKTTVSYFLEHIFKKAGKRSGVIGTINYRYADKIFPAPNTTPQSSDIYRILGEMAGERIPVCIMEVSSHALALGRVGSIEFDAGIFTNLTRDHLDFHKTMEEYFLAKSKLFENLKSGTKNRQKFGIINYDDPWGRKMKEILPQESVTTYAIKEKASFIAENVHITSKGTEFTLVYPDGKKKLNLSHIGLHNLYNALASAAAGFRAGISMDIIASAIGSVPAVPGRLQKVDAGQPFTVVVDYAHTDDALKNVLTTLRELKPERLITVFGCGGDRDRSKRPLMGDIASLMSDFVFVTSDNPRSEEPQRIALDIEVGIRRQHRNNYQVTLDREQAIASAINMAHKGDIVLIAGKGHENYQIVGSQTIHFNDTEMANKYLKKYLSSARVCC